MEKIEGAEAYEEASPSVADRHKTQRHTQTLQQGTSNQQTNDIKGQAVEHMEIDSQKKEDELDSKL